MYVIISFADATDEVIILAVCFVSALRSDLSSEPHFTLRKKNIAYPETRLRGIKCNIV
jgi:hypothetical protein